MSGTVRSTGVFVGWDGLDGAAKMGTLAALRVRGNRIIFSACTTRTGWKRRGTGAMARHAHGSRFVSRRSAAQSQCRRFRWKPVDRQIPGKRRRERCGSLGDACRDPRADGGNLDERVQAGILVDSRIHISDAPIRPHRQGVSTPI